MTGEPRYIQRDEQGKVIGHFSHPHPYAEEKVAEDHPDIIAWRAAREAEKAAYMARKAATDPAKLLAKIEELQRDLADLKARR